MTLCEGLREKIRDLEENQKVLQAKADSWERSFKSEEAERSNLIGQLRAAEAYIHELDQLMVCVLEYQERQIRAARASIAYHKSKGEKP